MEDVLIQLGLGMGTVMMETTIKSATMMVGTAVDPMSIHNTAQNVNALKTRIQQTVLKMKIFQAKILLLTNQGAVNPDLQRNNIQNVEKAIY